MSASFNGTPTNIEFFDNVGVQLSWVGANPQGTIRVQVSLDFDPRFPSDATWTAIQTSPGTDLTVLPGGTPGDAYIDLNELSGMWIRVVYTTDAGSDGNLSSIIALKGLQ